MLKTLDREEVITKISALSEQYSDILSYVVLFGSVARGTHNEKSDVDLFIRSNNLTTGKLLRSKGFHSFVNNLFTLFDDSVAFDRICVGGKRDTERIKNSLLWKEIQNDGVILYDRGTTQI